MKTEITSLEDFIKIDDYSRIKSEIDAFLRKFMEEHITKIDTILSAHRKGIRIIDEFFTENPDLDKFKLINDLNMDREVEKIKNLNILIFDDSINDGDTVIKIISKTLKNNPRSIKLLSLRINEKAKEKISKKFPQLENSVNSCKIFKTSEEQELNYPAWEMIFLDGLRENRNPDFSSLIIKLSPISIKKLSEKLIGIFEKEFQIEDISPVSKLADNRDSYCVTISIKDSKESPLNYLHDIYKSTKIQIEQQKIRFYIIDYKRYVKIIITPIIDWSFDPTICKVPQSSPENCLYKILKRKKTDFTCEVCIPLLVNDYIAEHLQHEINSYFKKEGIFIHSSKIEFPEVNRFIVHS
jgi:hypothetical protein